MFSLVCALASLTAASAVAGSTKGVVFERRYSADPCDDKAIILTTWVRGPKTFTHGFRLNCTDAVFFGYGTSATPIWQAPTNVLDVSTEMSFFKQQTDTVSRSVKSFLAVQGLITLYYEFNTRTTMLALDIYVSKKLVSRYRNGTVHFQSAFHDLGTEVKNFVKKHASGIRVDILKGKAADLQSKWLGFCTDMKKLANVTAGNYSLSYDSGKDETKCSVESRVSWFHLVFFDSTVATATKRDYNAKERTHLTVGSVKGKQFTVCNITFPDGMVALQSFVSEDGVEPTPPAPIVTSIQSRLTAGPPSPSTVSTRPTTISVRSTTVLPTPTAVSSFPIATSLGESPKSSPSPGTSNATEDDLGETSEASATGAGGVVASVFVVLLLLAGGIGVFLYRDRLMTVFPRFQRVPTEG